MFTGCLSRRIIGLSKRNPEEADKEAEGDEAKHAIAAVVMFTL